MRHNEAGRLAELVRRRIKRNDRRRRRRCLMTKDEKIEERERKRWRKRMLNGFLLEEADESEDEFTSETEEDGFRDAYANLLPLDSNGQP